MTSDERVSALEEKLERFLDATCKRLASLEEKEERFDAAVRAKIAELENAVADLQDWVVTKDPATFKSITKSARGRASGG